MFQLHPINYIFILFSFICIYLFLISLEKSHLTPGIFKSGLFNFHIFGNFPAIFLLVISTLMPLWFEKIFCKISVLNFMVCFMAQNIVCLGERPCVLVKGMCCTFVGYSVLEMFSRSSWLIVFYIFINLLYIVLCTTERGVDFFSCNYGCILVHQFLSHIFWSFIVSNIHI